MQSIDVHDLPESVARAIESMVQSIRQANGNGARSRAAAEPTLDRVLAPVLNEIDRIPDELRSAVLKGQELEVQDKIVDKFRKQGLKL